MAIVGGWKLKYKKRKPKPKPQTKAFKAYYKRNDRLSELGYEGYQQYLQSDDWKRIREKKLRRFPVCLLCPSPSQQVHHMDYSHEVLLGLESGLLVCLCEKCHEGIEFYPDGNKRTLKQANVELRRLAHGAGLQRWLVSVNKARERLKKMRRLAGRKRMAERRRGKK